MSFENFLEIVSTEEAGKAQESILGGEENEYVASPSRPDSPPGKNFQEPSLLTEVASGDAHSQHLGMAEETHSAYSEFDKRLPSSGQSPGQEPPSEEQALNPYLKNSVTTREFLVHENFPEHYKGEI